MIRDGRPRHRVFITDQESCRGHMKETIRTFAVCARLETPQDNLFVVEVPNQLWVGLAALAERKVLKHALHRLRADGDYSLQRRIRHAGRERVRHGIEGEAMCLDNTCQDKRETDFSTRIHGDAMSNRGRGERQVGRGSE